MKAAGNRSTLRQHKPTIENFSSSVVNQSNTKTFIDPKITKQHVKPLKLPRIAHNLICEILPRFIYDSKGHDIIGANVFPRDY